MVSRPQIEKLSSRIEALAAAADGGGRPAYVWRDAGESEEQAIARLYRDRPEDRQARQIYVFEWEGAS
jgi:hypothetical protein